jgi:hypothetical protein
MTRIVKRQEELNTEYVERLVKEYKDSKKVLEDIEKRTNGLKKELNDYVQEYGMEDDKGHLWLSVGDTKLKRERRVSRSLDLSGARAWAEENGHWDDVKEIVETLSEDKLLNLAWVNKDLEETIQSFYIEKETWAFKA